MKLFFPLLFFFFISCMPQNSTQKQALEFEDIYHHSFNFIPANYQIIDSQEKMNTLYKQIHAKYGGERMAPIPTIVEGETYIVFKPNLKETNDVEIQEIYLQNDTVFIKVKPFQNPQIEKTQRSSPNIIIKILQKITAKKLVINSI